MTIFRRTHSMIMIIGGLMLRPHFWPIALRVGARMIPQKWWTRRPYLPVPRKDYLKFRLETQYGGHAPVANLPDVLRYLRWVREWDAQS
ncbi:MAG: hypothetical protein WCG40_01020 [Actinomycetes bacterium]